MADQAPAGKLILITGVTRGLGHALAAGFAAGGHTVLGCGRDAEVIRRLREEHLPPHNFARVDVSADGEVKAWIGALLASHGPPDLVINNAAMINANAPLWEVPAEEIDRILSVNLGGTVNVIRHVAPALIAAGAGVIANISSTWGRSTAAEVAPYCMTKWGIEGLTRALHDDLQAQLPGAVAAVAVNPGIIDTDMLRSCFGGGAGGYPSPETWASRAIPFFLALGPRDSGQGRDI